MHDNKDKRTKIKVVEKGPYIVTGNIPLGEKIIVPKGESVEFTEGRELIQNEEYALCRCGKSQNPPFCDGAHERTQFIGTETASKEKYVDRAVIEEGISIDLYDDERCAFARFCHSENGIPTWNLMDYADDEIIKNEVIRTASNCPAGRLTAAEKNGEMIEPAFEPAIEIIQDPSRGASGGIYVKGGVPLESTEGTLYETRNRYVLCRCGKSHNKPFCDAAHIIVEFRDNKSDEN